MCRSRVQSSNLEIAMVTGAQLPTRSFGERTTLGKLAEGEELRSNLLHAIQSSGGPGVPEDGPPPEIA
jgi:hypothetical protein